MTIAGWLITKYEETTNFLLISAAIIEIIFLILILVALRKSKELIEEIGNTKKDD